MEENQTPKQDMVDRKAAWIERMFDRLFAAIQKDTKVAIIVVLVGVVIWQQIISNKKDERWIADITKLNDKINAAVERSVERQLDIKMIPIEAKQDSVYKNVDTSLNNLNGSIETFKKSVKEKFKK